MVCLRSIALFGVIFGVAFLGCEKATPNIKKSYGDSLVITTYHAPAGINPLTSVSGISSMLADVVFDPLIKIDEKIEARPALASSWQVSGDGLRYTFFLRKGVKFHDGVEFTAEDVKFTLDEMIHARSTGPSPAGLIAMIQSIHIKDRYTLEIVLQRPSLFFLHSLDVGILPAHLLKDKHLRKGFGINPVGTGPFKLTEWKEDEIIFESNKDYFPGRPYLNTIVVKIYPNQELAWARLMRGEGDFLIPVDPTVYNFLDQVPFLNIKTYRLYYSMIVFNNNNELFRDEKVRVALNYAVDKGYIIQDMLKGRAEVAASAIWPDSRFYNPSVEPYSYNPKKALLLLKDAGWIDRDRDHILDKDGKRFVFTLFTNEGDEIKERAAMHIQQQLWELGIRMEIKTFSTASMDFIFQGRFDALFIDIFSHFYPDFSYNIWHSSQMRGLGNICRYRSETVDKLLWEGRTSRDMDSAKEIYNQFQKEMHDNPPGIFLYWADTIIGIHKRFRGVRLPPGKLLTYINEWYVPEGEQKYEIGISGETSMNL